MKCNTCSVVFNPKPGSTGKFCSKSCAARFNNQNRKHSEATKIKIQQSQSKPRGPRSKGHCKVKLQTCSVCEAKFYLSIQSVRTTCSKVCQTKASTSVRSYQNGSRKPSLYFCQYQGKEVWLDSSWEVAIASQLDALGMKWSRPDPIQWRDQEGRVRLYYPDFYLVELDTYLDPKNPFCMEQDREKMAAVSQQIKLVYGPLETIKDFIHEKSET